MDGPFADRKRGFLDGLGAGRMRVAGSCQVLGRSAKLHQNRGFMDHFAGLAADDMHAKHPVRLRICENLHEAVSGLVDLGTAIGGEGEFARNVRHAGLFQLFLGLADR